MALTYTPVGELGSQLPQFSLPATDGKNYSTQMWIKNQRPIVVMYICNHCPYVQAIEDRLISLALQYAEKVQFIAICSNDSSDYEEDSFENLALRSKQKNYPFPYLYDESQSVAKSMGAVCTPDIFLYDASGILNYRGRLDDSWKDASKVRKKELQLAIEKCLSGEEIALSDQNPSMGCSIKWK